jgi:hypothetical protein
VEELEVKLKKEEAARLTADIDQKKKPGVKDTIEVNKLKKEVKMKVEELDRHKTQAKKVSTVTAGYCWCMIMSVYMFLELELHLPRFLSL